MAKIGVQMFTLREESAKDFVGTLEKVAELGFQGVEFAGYYGMTAAALNHELERLNLTAISAHVPIDQLRDNLEDAIAFQKAIGAKYIVCPFLQEDERDNYEALIPLFKKVAEECKKEGLQFGYHHHAFELEPYKDSDGMTYMLQELSADEMFAEFDIYWLRKAGKSPAEWLQKYAGRTPLVHLKDMAEDGSFAELGAGDTNLQEVLAEEKNSNVEWWIVEQDVCKGPAIDSVAQSIRHLKSIL
ncbi:sugar phosphate isomerase/epimerase family protein [Aureibacillus halotolerans]|uniref:Sugar phosphate isomerase/epimerase n=1 Tax=Aureibacillus halotolerans TaxID=1508390 RepID=A0A4R6TSQ5_9BACI|nr:sugar phosphate isomerase/epimerase [Aureibacillus halotolerans]TDQ36096.1 sugar phosphate isomerase/epimerase [Aureibacillus halotolerans]